jgi:hypothetical protein
MKLVPPLTGGKAGDRLSSDGTAALSLVRAVVRCLNDSEASHGNGRFHGIFLNALGFRTSDACFLLKRECVLSFAFTGKVSCLPKLPSHGFRSLAHQGPFGIGSSEAKPRTKRDGRRWKRAPAR